MRIRSRREPTGAVTLLVAGILNASAVADFDRALERARQGRRPVVLDLSDVRLIDRPALKYLIDLMQNDVRLIVCPDYVEHWIYREMGRESRDEVGGLF
jgi:anti-anti-sigma regulatory factor